MTSSYTFDHIRGHASGYEYHPGWDGGWEWRAWCGGNSRTGRASRQEAARQLASAARDELERAA